MANKPLFGTDGVRGRVNDPTSPMRPDIIQKLGMAIGIRHRNGKRQKVLLAKDTRQSGYMFESAITTGLVSVGVDVIQLGPMPTPAVAMLIKSLRVDFGVMITASHNPYYDNGIKLFDRNGLKLSQEDERRIEDLVNSDLTPFLASPDRCGKAKRIDGVIDRYVEAVKHTFPDSMDLEGLRIVVDCAHGAGYKTAPMVLRELGADVVAIGIEPNGTNINAGFGATNPDELVKKVLERRADFGFALDGDADRVLCVDENGMVIDGDQILAVVASNLAQQGGLKGGGVVGTVMSNIGLERYIASMELMLHRAPVGDRFVSEEMHRLGANVGGEQSGHIILSDFTTTGDGLIAALQVLALICKEGKLASEVCRRFKPYPQILRNIQTSNPAVLQDDRVQEAIAAAKAVLGDAYVVVRASGTEPLLRVMVQGEDQETVQKQLDLIMSAVESSRA